VRTFLTALVALSVIGSPLAAPADLTARVTFNGDGVPGATVTATLGDRRAETTTDEAGQFRFADLADGTWTIRVDMRGFIAATRDVTVPSAQPLAPFALVLQSYADAVAGSPKPAATAKTDAEVTSPNNAATDPEHIDIINGSVVNGATTPFALSPAFGNGRPRGRSLYSGGLSVVVGNSAWNASPYSFVGGGPSAPSYGNVQVGATIGGPLKIPWLVTHGPNTVVAFQHNVSQTVTT